MRHQAVNVCTRYNATSHGSPAQYDYYANALTDIRLKASLRILCRLDWAALLPGYTLSYPSLNMISRSRILLARLVLVIFTYR